MANLEKIQEQVDQNYEFFATTLLPELIRTSAGKWVLLRNRELVAVFDTARDAVVAGEKLYEDELFSIQKVTTRIADLGWFSRALP